LFVCFFVCLFVSFFVSLFLSFFCDLRIFGQLLLICGSYKTLQKAHNQTFSLTLCTAVHSLHLDMPQFPRLLNSQRSLRRIYYRVLLIMARQDAKWQKLIHLPRQQK
jgi:hypothetical protein